MSYLELGNEWLFETPGMGSVQAIYTNQAGAKKTVTLLDIHASELQIVGDVDLRSDAQYKLVRQSEVPTRPVRGETFEFNDFTYRLKSAESGEVNINWILDFER